MTFGKELCNLSAEAEKKCALLREGKAVWDSIKKALKEFAQETGERGCNVFFKDVPKHVIAQLEQLAKTDEIELMHWNSSSDEGHLGRPFEEIRIITWDRTWYFSKNSNKVSRYSLLVSNDDGIKVEMVVAEASLLPDSDSDLDLYDKLWNIIKDCDNLQHFSTQSSEECEYCNQCSDFTLLPDPDPYDWFRDGDMKAVCLKVNGVIEGSLETPSEWESVERPLYCPKLGRELSEEEKKKAEERLKFAQERMNKE